MEEKEIRYLARLAHIKLDKEEIENLKADLEKLLEYVGQLKTLPTQEIEPTSSILNAYNRFREDKIMSSLSVEKALENAPEKEKNFFRVPRVISENHEFNE